MTLAALMYTLTGAVVRHLADSYSVFEVGFFRSIVAVAILLPAVCGFRVRRIREVLRTDRFSMHLLRTGLSYVGIMAWFYGVSRIPLSDYYALQFLTPLFTMAGAALLLGEATRLRNWLAVLVGFAGAMVIVRPGFAEVGFGTLAALGAALVFASVNNAARVLSRTDSATHHRRLGQPDPDPVVAASGASRMGHADMGRPALALLRGPDRDGGAVRDHPGGGDGRGTDHPAARFRPAAVRRRARLDRLRRRLRSLDLGRRGDHLRRRVLRAPQGEEIVATRSFRWKSAAVPIGKLA